MVAVVVVVTVVITFSFTLLLVSKLRPDVFNSCMKLNLSTTVAVGTGETGRCREV